MPLFVVFKTPPDAATLKSFSAMLGCSMRDIIRTGEDLYRQLGLKDKSLSEEQLTNVVAENPKLLERPIVVNNGKAAVGRPPENVLAILGGAD